MFQLGRESSIFERFWLPFGFHVDAFFILFDKFFGHAILHAILERKNHENKLVQVGKGESFATEAGLSGGGGGFASHLCKYLLRLLFSTPCYL